MSFENGMRPVHPAEVLRGDHPKPLGMSAHALVKRLKPQAPYPHLGVPPSLPRRPWKGPP